MFYYDTTHVVRVYGDLCVTLAFVHYDDDNNAVVDSVYRQLSFIFY